MRDQVGASSEEEEPDSGTRRHLPLRRRSSSSEEEEMPRRHTPMTKFSGKTPSTDWVEILMYKMQVRLLP